MSERPIPRGLIAGLCVAGLLALCSWLGPLLTVDGDALDLAHVQQPPSPAHWMGTDALGRDLAARVVEGGRVSLQVAALSALFALVVGLPLGAIAGYFAGWFDALLGRAMEAILAFPTLLLVIVLLSDPPAWIAGAADALRISLVIGLTGWIPVARYTRAEILRWSGSSMLDAGRAVGCAPLRLIARHLVPNGLAPVLVTLAFTASGAILVESSLSFLGWGVSPPTPTWGGLLAEAREGSRVAWWMVVFPGTALFVAVLACNLIGEGIRDWLDPRHRESR